MKSFLSETTLPLLVIVSRVSSTNYELVQKGSFPTMRELVINKET